MLITENKGEKRKRSFLLGMSLGFAGIGINSSELNW